MPIFVALALLWRNRHAHVPSGPAGTYARDDVLFLWVANGVTVARGMLGAPEHLQLRADLAVHRVLGPRLITAGPSFNGNSVQSPEQGAQMVREQKAAGYNFLKLHPGLSRESFLAIARTAQEEGITLAGTSRRQSDCSSRSSRDSEPSIISTGICWHWCRPKLAKGRIPTMPGWC